MSEYLYGFKPPKTMFEMTWEEVQEALKETDMVVLAAGSVEQHGPHLPLGTDALMARESARRLVVRLGEMGIKAVAGPTIPFGVCSYHLPFPGTIHIQTSTFQAMVYDVVMSLYRHGFRRFVLVMGHGGNLASLQVVGQKFVDDTEGTRTLVLNSLKVMMEHYDEILVSKKNEGHSGEGETSRLMATHPELIQMQRAHIYYSDASDRAETKDHPLRGGGIFKGTRSWKEVTPYGSVGNPTLAKAETGEKLLAVRTNWMAEAVKQEFC